MTLLALYLGALALGGILIGASLLGGSTDGDADGDAGDHGGDHGGDAAEVDADHGGDHGHGHDHVHDHDHAHHDPAASGAGTAVLATLLSLRFWTFALAAFGLTGALLELFGMPAFVSLPVSVLDGLFIGVAVSTLMRNMARDTVSSAVEAKHLAGRDAEVILSVGPGKLGKVRLTYQGQILELPATTRETRLIDRLERVLVVDVRNGTADITPVEPLRPHPTSQTESS